MTLFVVGILVNFLSGTKAYHLVSCECTKISIMSTVACESSIYTMLYGLNISFLYIF